MPIDTSIYSNIRQPDKIDITEPMQKAMALSNLAIQNKHADLQNKLAEKQLGAKDYEQQAKALDFHINQAGAIAQLAMGATDQSSYEAALGQAKKMGMDTSMLPQQFDPGTIKTIAYNALDQQKRLAAQKQQYEIPNIQSQTARNYAESGKANAEKDKVQSETIKRNPDGLAEENDPAKMVVARVPKEHQAKALSEVESAENTKANAPGIFAAFDNAANNLHPTDFIPGTQNADQKSLHALLGPTFKDVEGTVRQAAMDNLFSNITPQFGDSKATIQKKQEALQGYINAKFSAPTARGYGVDLNDFKSTAPYQVAKKSDSNSGGIVPGQNAQADAMPKHGTVEGGYVFLGGDPANPKSWMRAK